MSTIALTSGINILPTVGIEKWERLFQTFEKMKSQHADHQKSPQSENSNMMRQKEASLFQSSQSSNNSLTIPQEITIFIDACNEAMDLAQQIEHDICNIPNIYNELLHPLDTTLRPSAIYQTIKKNVLACDVIIVPFQENVPLEWLHTRMKYYKKTHVYRDCHRPLYVNIFTQDPESVKHAQFKNDSSRLHIRDCHHIEQCLKIEEN
jgi:hypothetical protein